MADLHAAVVGYLAERSWPYEDRDGVIVTPVVLSSGSWTVFFEIRDQDQQLIVYSLVPVWVPVERRTDAALYIARANYGLAIGNFEIDLDDGEVRFRTSVDVEGAEISAPIVDHLFLANVMGVEQYLEGLRSVIEGADPSAAIAVAEDAVS
jgi:hypothetical protein